jgi:aspartate aminotransferase
LNSIEEYRAKIRQTDKQLLALIKERLALAGEVAAIKKNEGLPTINLDAENAAMINLSQCANELGISPLFAKRLGELLIEETIRVENASHPDQSKDQMLKEIFELTQKLTSRGVKVTRFEIGEPNFPAPAQAIGALSSTFRKNKIVGYGSAAGLPQLRAALADELNREHGTKIEADQVLVTPGARFGIFGTITSFVSSLERVVIPQPAWPAYEECVSFIDGRTVPVNTQFEEGWDIDVGLLESELRRDAKVLILNSPSNPTGKVIPDKKFKEVVELAAKYDTMILSDEVYDRYVRSPVASILETGYDNFVYINSFSKQFSLTGWRIAYLVTSKEKALRIRRVIQTAMTCVPEFIQNAALVAIKKDRKEAQRNINAILRKVDLTCRELERINVSFHKPKGAFYVFPKANKPNFDSAKFARQLLEEHHVSISPGQSFGDYPAFFRLAVSLPEAQIPSAIKRIGKAIDAWQ